jgi:hypothetical protein
MPLAIILVCVGIYVVGGVTWALTKQSDFDRRIKKLESNSDS